MLSYRDMNKIEHLGVSEGKFIPELHISVQVLTIRSWIFGMFLLLLSALLCTVSGTLLWYGIAVGDKSAFAVVLICIFGLIFLLPRAFLILSAIMTFVNTWGEKEVMATVSGVHRVATSLYALRSGGSGFFFPVLDITVNGNSQRVLLMKSYHVANELLGKAVIVRVGSKRMRVVSMADTSDFRNHLRRRDIGSALWRQEISQEASELFKK